MLLEPFPLLSFRHTLKQDQIIESYSRKHVWIMPKSHLNDAQNRAKTYPNHGQNMSKIEASLVQASSKLGTSLLQAWFKLGPNLVQTWSKLGLNLVYTWSTLGLNFFEESCFVCWKINLVSDMSKIWVYFKPELIRKGKLTFWNSNIWLE